MTEDRSLVLISNSPRLQIEHMPTSQLKRNARNPRKHPDKQIMMLARNIDNVGFLIPCLIDEKDRLLTGHARVLAAERLGMTEIPVIRIQHLTETEKRAFVIGDNRLSELASWDPDILRSELQVFADLNIDFDFSAIGFETLKLIPFWRPVILTRRISFRALPLTNLRSLDLAIFGSRDRTAYSVPMRKLLLHISRFWAANRLG
jgi:hypothetical protein